VKVYYNEFDKKAAAWLRELIKEGHIAPGDVDERSIEDVVPDELVGYTQCHFFAGIGVWSYALRRAGWPDDRAIWTASCPCQPYSQAGEGAGFADERHLWPHLYHLIGQRRPGIVIGEQVASKDANPWVDLVHTDLEAMAYAFGAVAFPSAGIGAPHIRDRTYWVAHAAGRATIGRGTSPELTIQPGAT
jgi:DNA (cytosine-5)-methyltransferase 1